MSGGGGVDLTISTIQWIMFIESIRRLLYSIILVAVGCYRTRNKTWPPIGWFHSLFDCFVSMYPGGTQSSNKFGVGCDILQANYREFLSFKDHWQSLVHPLLMCKETVIQSSHPLFTLSDILVLYPDIRCVSPAGQGSRRVKLTACFAELPDIPDENCLQTTIRYSESRLQYM